MGGTASSRNAWLSLAAVLVGAMAVPLGLRAVNAAVRPPAAQQSYIPSIESPRVRQPFDQEAIDTLREAANDYILIGDSMAGTRIDPGHLSRLVGGHGAAALFHPGSASAYWYLAFKNLVVSAGLRPKAVVFFFRDENLTEPLFRLYPGSLDRVARTREPSLDAILAARSEGVYYRFHAAVRALYQHDQTRTWLEPILSRAPVPLAAGRRARRTLLDEIDARVFAVEALRPTAAADMEAGRAAALDFARNLPTSVLPEIIRLSIASGIRVACVRVQRRPGPDGPPAQSPALQQYVRDLRHYLESNGAVFHDDWGDTELPLAVYEDGDHVKREFKRPYTELLVRRNPEIFR
jgi:hypothetical protein